MDALEHLYIQFTVIEDEREGEAEIRIWTFFL